MISVPPAAVPTSRTPSGRLGRLKLGIRVGIEQRKEYITPDVDEEEEEYRSALSQVAIRNPASDDRSHVGDCGEHEQGVDRVVRGPVVGCLVEKHHQVANRAVHGNPLEDLGHQDSATCQLGSETRPSQRR